MRVEKRSVLDAAARVLAQNPRASTREIAAAAGISRATLHRLFPARDTLMEELGMLVVEQISAAYAAARLDEGSVGEALERLVKALIPLVHQFAYLVAETQLLQNEHVMAGDRELQEQTERLMRRGQADGSLRVDLPAAWLVHSLAGLLLAAEEAVRMGDIAPRETSRLILESFLRGAAARPNGAFDPSPFIQIGKDQIVRKLPPADSATTPLQIDLRDPHTRASAFSTYAGLRAQNPVAPAILTASDQDDQDFTGTTGRQIWLAAGYDDALETLADDRFAVDGRAVMTPEQLAELPPVPDEFHPFLRNLLSLDPPDHTRLRRLVQPSFTPRAMEALRPRIEAIANGLLDAAEREAAARGESAPNRTIELVDAFAYPLPMTVISELLGVPEADRSRVRAWSEAMVESESFSESQYNAIVAFSDYLRDMFEQKRQHPTGDLTSQLVQAEEEGDKLDDEELLSMVFILIVAGHVTTVNLIGNSVLALLNYPDQLARLKANPELIKGAVEETLRFWGPVEMASPRFAREAVDLNGVTIARGQAVMPVLASADRDPARFADPDRFDIERADASRHIAFGKGVHLCLGAPLARVEGQVALATLVNRMPELRLAGPMTEPPLHPSLFRGPERLPLLF